MVTVITNKVRVHLMSQVFRAGQSGLDFVYVFVCASGIVGRNLMKVMLGANRFGRALR
jgi:hypothetical protein